MPLKNLNPKPLLNQALYLGIDPGVSGGLVTLWGSQVRAQSMPSTLADLWGWFREQRDQALEMKGLGELFAVVEKVGGYIGEGRPGSAMFNFGVSYGTLLMGLTAAEIPYEEVTPQRWQKAMGITPRKKAKVDKTAQDEGRKQWIPAESTTQFKNRLKARAQQLFPKVKVTLAVSDALLIAEYCRRWRRGLVQ
jgi:hypothetical protein